ncbi:MAG: 50S ribosomal protein L23 [Deltaproteobacteria bacterium]|nr:50S ribosomal protein L23 [Deltaproteobacteria bacterium]
MNPYQILMRPVITEKSTLAKEVNNHLVFEVHPRSNKVEIAKAVEQIFKVQVTGVRTMTVRGKTRRRGRIAGRQKNWKKAVVSVAPGQRVEFFEGA